MDSWSRDESNGPLKARVKTFDGTEVVITVSKVWFWAGEPLRVWGYGPKGNYFKFKQDEEPFKLHGLVAISEE